MRLTNKCPSRSLAILRFALPAQVVKLVDTLASGASARKSGGSSPLLGTKLKIFRTHTLPMRVSRLENQEDCSSFAPEALALVGSQPCRAYPQLTLS